MLVLVTMVVIVICIDSVLPPQADITVVSYIFIN